MGVPVQNILFTVFQSICQVFLLCLAGFTLSFKGIVDKPTSKALNHLNIALFTPALLFSKVAFFLTPAKLRQLWVIPIFFTILTALSAIVAHVLARACRLKRTQVNFATAASMFMNSNSLPVALMQSLASTVPLLKWGTDDTIDAMFGRSLTYLVVFSTLGMMLRWSYGVCLLSQADEPEPHPSTYRDDPLIIDSAIPRLVDYETETDCDTRDKHPRRTRSPRARLPPRLTPLSRRYSHPHPHPHPRMHSLLPAVPASLGDQSESDDTDELDTTEGESEDTLALRSDPIDTGCSTEAEDHGPSQPTPRWDRPAPSLLSRLLGVLTSLSPPLVASLLALLCVLIAPLQRALNSDGMLPFKGALDSAGACSVPLTMLVLGGWFWDDSKGAVRDAQVNANATANVKIKGKGLHATPPFARPGHAVHVPQSHNSSTASLSSLLGTVGDVLMARIHAPRRSRWHANAVISGDVEPGLATHTETDAENGSGNGNGHEHGRGTANGSGRVSRSRSRNGRARPPPLSPSSPTPTPPPPHKNPPGETLTIFVTLFARMVVVPLIATPLMVLVSRVGWGGDVFEDPVFIVSSMLLVSSPPALTLAQISQRAKSNTKTPSGARTATRTDTELSPFERLLSRTVFWAYLVLTPPITIVSVMVGLLMIGA